MSIFIYAVSNYGINYVINLTLIGYEETHIWSYKPAPLFYLFPFSSIIQISLKKVDNAQS
jgi:hypothetical protein